MFEDWGSGMSLQLRIAHLRWCLRVNRNRYCAAIRTPHSFIFYSEVRKALLREDLKSHSTDAAVS
jgi:hypothetical protein